MHVSVERAFGTGYAAGQGGDDITRVLKERETVCLLVCSGGECGWGGRAYQASRAFLDNFEVFWRRSAQPLPVRLLSALRGAGRKFRREFCVCLETAAAVGPPWISVAAVVLSQGRGFCAWVGGEEAYLLHQGHIVAQNRPDTLPYRLERPCKQNNFQAIPRTHTTKLNALVRAINQNEPVRIRLVEWELPLRGEVVILNYQFPEALPLAEAVALLKPRRALWPWKKAPQWPHGCVVRCEFRLGSDPAP